MSEERLDTLENAMKRLAESEARAWEEIGKLSKSQMEQEARHDRLAESEAKAWEAIGRMADGYDALRQLVERFIRAQSDGRN